MWHGWAGVWCAAGLARRRRSALLPVGVVAILCPARSLGVDALCPAAQVCEAIVRFRTIGVRLDRIVASDMSSSVKQTVKHHLKRHTNKR